MGENCAKEELGTFDGACLVLDGIVPEGLDRKTVKGCQECLQHEVSCDLQTSTALTYASQDPDNRAPKQNLDGNLDVGNSKHAPVKCQDGDLGEKEGKGVDVLDEEEEFLGCRVCIFKGHALDVGCV